MPNKNRAPPGQLLLAFAAERIISKKMNEALWFLIHDGKLLFCNEASGPVLPRAARPPLPVSSESGPLERLDNAPCRAAALEGDVPEGWLALDLFEVNKRFGRELYSRGGRAAQLAYWRKNSRFCPVCS